MGETVKMSYVDQTRETLDPNKSVWEEISGGNDLIKLGIREVNSRAYVSWFNFSGSDQEKKVVPREGSETVLIWLRFSSREPTCIPEMSRQMISMSIR